MENHNQSFIVEISKLNNQNFKIKDILNLKDNKQYLDYLLQDPFIDQLNQFCKDNQIIDIDSLKIKLDELTKSLLTDKFLITDFITFLFIIFMRENCTGPSVYTQYVEETKAPLIIGGPLPDNPLDPISSKNEQLQQVLLKYFERDSEQIYIKTQFLILFFVIEYIITNKIDTNEEFKNDKYLKLWKARFYYSYDKQLTSSIVHLQDNSLNLYNELVEEIEKTEANSKQLALLLIEQSYCQLNFYKYKQAKQSIKKAQAILGLNLKLTGKLGRRTKYQEFDIAQLVLDIENRNVIVKEVQHNEIEENLQNVKLEEDTILYEEPKITDPTGELQKKELIPEDQVLIQAYINYITTSRAKEETRTELLRPYIQVVCQKSLNWLIYSQALLHRSKNELESNKTVERALLQFQTLIDQFRDKEPATGEKLNFSFTINYPFIWQMKRDLAKQYMKIGVYVSAYEMLREVELYEDCILAMFLAGRSTLAEQLAQEQIQKFNNPNILCLLGDIKKDESYYQKAWDESKGKCARAMRSLGRQYFFQGQYQKSIECFEKGLAINRLYKDAWFTLGCAYMRIEDFKNAVFGFGNCVQIDDTNSEAWANISICYMQQERHKEAVVCLEQALKINRKNWKLWENYIILSIETLSFYKAISGTKELMRQDKFDRVNSTLLLRLCDVFLKKYVADYNEEKIDEKDFNMHKKTLYQVFTDYTNKQVYDWKTWRLIARIKGILREDPIELKDIKLREIRSLMQLNWENEIQTCEFVERGIEELLQLEKDLGFVLQNDEKVFLRNTLSGVEKCLQRKAKVEL